MGNYYLYRLGSFLARSLPLAVSSLLVGWLCDLHFFFSRADRQAVQNNLKIILKTDRAPLGESRAVFRYFGRYLLEFFRMTKTLNLEFIRTNVRVVNLECLNQVLQQGKGAILVSAHLGNWEMGGAVLPLLGYPLSVVALSHQDPKVNALFNAQREAFGAQVIQTNVAVRRVTEHLHQNRLVAILADRDFGAQGMVTDFLGRKTMIPKGAAFFSLKTGAPIVPIFFIRTKDGHFEINVYPSIDPPVLSNGKLTQEAAAACINQYLPVIEGEIKKNPSQWLIFREFWKS